MLEKFLKKEEEVKMEEKTDLLPAISTYYNRLKAFMDFDPEITTELDYDNSKIILTITNTMKAFAWREILPETKTIGTNTFSIEIETEHGCNEDVLLTAMEGNKLFSRYHETEMGGHYCYFKPEVIQFKNDNYSSPESLETRLAEDLIKDLVEIPTLCFCTETVNRD